MCSFFWFMDIWDTSILYNSPYRPMCHGEISHRYPPVGDTLTSNSKCSKNRHYSRHIFDEGPWMTISQKALPGFLMTIIMCIYIYVKHICQKYIYIYENICIYRDCIFNPSNKTGSPSWNKQNKKRQIEGPASEIAKNRGEELIFHRNPIENSYETTMKKEGFPWLWSFFKICPNGIIFGEALRTPHTRFTSYIVEHIDLAVEIGIAQVPSPLRFWWAQLSSIGAKLYQSSRFLFRLVISGKR